MVDFSNVQVGFSAEVTYGTAVVPTRGLAVEMDGFDMNGEYDDVVSEAVKTGFRVRPSRRSSRYLKGASGTLKLDVEDKGFGYWLKQMLGSVVVNDLTTHKSMVATPGTLVGLSSTIEAVQPFTNDTTETIKRFSGVKVTGATLSCDKNGLLQCSLDLDGRSMQTELDTLTKGTLVYPTTPQLFYYGGATVTIDGTTPCAQGFELTWDNNLNTEKDGLCNQGLKDQPTALGVATGQVKVGVRWESRSWYTKYVSASPAARECAIVATFNTPAFITGAIYGQVKVEIPVADITGTPPSDLSGDLIEELTFDVLQVTAGTAPITITYLTTDVTP